jgi:hypothetical protein
MNSSIAELDPFRWKVNFVRIIHNAMAFMISAGVPGFIT